MRLSGAGCCCSLCCCALLVLRVEIFLSVWKILSFFSYPPSLTAPRSECRAVLYRTATVGAWVRNRLWGFKLLQNRCIASWWASLSKWKVLVCCKLLTNRLGKLVSWLVALVLLSWNWKSQFSLLRGAWVTASARTQLLQNIGRDTWLILPVVICLSQRLSHACLSTSQYWWNREWLIKSHLIYRIVSVTWITAVILELIHA